MQAESLAGSNLSLTYRVRRAFSVEVAPPTIRRHMGIDRDTWFDLCWIRLSIT